MSIQEFEKSSDSQKLTIAQKLVKWFKVTISIELLGVEILHLEFPPDSSSKR